MQIEPMTDSHADAVLAIYQAGIDEGDATFETSAPSWATFTATRLPAHRYVATDTARSWAGSPPQPSPTAASTTASSRTRSTSAQTPGASGSDGGCWKP